MQLTLPLLSPKDPTRRTISIGRRTYLIRIMRHRRARRFLLRVASDGTLRLTVPRGASVPEGLGFAARQAEWIERERARQRRRAQPWRHGSVVLFRGQEEPLHVMELEVSFGDQVIDLPSETEDVRPAVEAHLRALADRELPRRCAELAAVHDLSVAGVSVRNQQSRWGACSPRRVIMLNWRLVQMPPAVCEYVLLHELMHLRQPNHSRRFWREVQSVCPHWRESERWLRRHGREIL